MSDFNEKFLSARVKNVQESQTLKVVGKISKMIKDGYDVVNLSVGEPDFPTPDFICDSAIKAINENFTKYTPNNGIIELRKAISEKLLKENNLSYTPEEIIVSTGGKQAIANVILTLCDKDDEVIIPSPYWVSYPEMVHLADGKCVIIKSDIDTNFKITPEQLKNAISPKTKIFILNSPSNPTGTVYSEKEIRALMDVIIDKDIFVISDEIYEHLIYGEIKHFSPAQILEMKEKIIVCNGVSKAYSMTGWRIGYAAAPEWIIKASGKIQSQMTSNACSISQKAALSAFMGDQSVVQTMKNEFAKRRDFMFEEINKIDGFKTNYPDGAFYIFPSIKGLIGKTLHGVKINNSLDFATYLLEKYHVGTVPGDAFGADGYLRLSYADSMENLEKAIKRIREAVKF